MLNTGPHHLFEGDGMLHCIKISGGLATLCSRYVHTYRFTVQRAAGAPIFPKVFSGYTRQRGSLTRSALFAARILAGHVNPANGIGLANTSLALFGGNLYALGESDLPYAVKLAPDGDIITLGRCNFDDKLFTSMTAHPKTDPDTGETFAFQTQFGFRPPFLTYFRFNADGTKTRGVPVFSMNRPSFVHDFAITEKYAVFMDIQIELNLKGMVVRGRSPVGVDPEKVTRIGVIPRYAGDETEMRWFDVPGFNVIHVINAWDEEGGDAVVMVAPNVSPVEEALERTELLHASVEKVRIDLKTGIVSRHPLSAMNLDFAVINPAYVGKKNK